MKVIVRMSLVVLWLKICLPVQRTQVPSLVREDSTCRRAMRPHVTNTEAHQGLHASTPTEACTLQQRSHCSERPARCNWRVATAHGK